MKFQVAQLM